MDSIVLIWIVPILVLATRQCCKHRAWHGKLQFSPLDVGEIALAVACGLSSICLGEGRGLDHGVSEDFIFEPRGSMSTRFRFGMALSEFRASPVGAYRGLEEPFL